MKKFNLSFLVLALSYTTFSQEVNWRVGLNTLPLTEEADFGTSSDHAINFYTNGTKKMTLNSDGNLQLNGSLNLSQGILFDSENAFRKETYISEGATSSYLMLGKGAAPDPGDVFLGPCSTPNANGWTVTNGGLISGAFGMPTPNQVNAFLKLFTSNTNGNGYLELEGVNNSGNTANALFINNNCGRNTNINLNSGGVFMGSFVNMKKHLEIGDPSTGITSPSNNVALDIHTHTGTGIRFTTNTDAMELVTVENNSNSTFKKTFTVFGDGKTEISTENADAFMIKNLNYSNNVSFNVKSDGRTEIYTYMPKALSIWSQNTGVENFAFNTNGSIDIKTTVSNLTDNVLTITDNSNNTKNFVVKRNGVVYAREVHVATGTFPDYVFASDYALPKLDEVKKFIEKNHRLPHMPSASEVEKNGANLGEIQRVTVEKVEELYLYILQLKEELDALKKEGCNLKK